MKLVAITGANGMIGRRIVCALLNQGVRIKALVRHDMPTVENVEYVVGDITSIDAVKSVLKGVDTVFHCAAELKNDQLMQNVNVNATKNLASTAVSMGVACFIHLSSAGVVGPSRKVWIDETSPCSPDNAYEISKYKAEQALSKIDLKNMRLCILRPTNVIDNDRPGVLAMARHYNWKNKIFTFVKGGEAVHLVHAKDVSAAAIYIASAEHVLSGTFFVGCDEDKGNVLSEVLNTCLDAMAKKEGCTIYLPVVIPYWIRLIIRGRSLHGHSRFSSAKLMSTGFKFPLGLEEAILSICKEQEIHRS